MLGDEHTSIILDLDTLCEHHIPSQLPQREEQARRLAQALCLSQTHRKPVHCWVSGPSGAGKTAAARWLLSTLEAEMGVKGLYVNCWEHPTYYAVLDKIVRELRVLGADRLTVSFKLERLQRHLGNRPFLIVLDEVDQPAPRERHSILYHLSQMGNVGLLCLCNSEHVYFALEDRVKSRLNPTRVCFPCYTEDDLEEILRQRAHRALAPQSWSDMTLRHVAHLARGDARIAIHTLRNAAVLADKDRSARVQMHHVDQAWNAAKDVKVSHLLSKLTEHHRTLYGLIVKRPGVLSGDLWRVYLRRCQTSRTKPIALRTYSEYCNDLTNLGLVRAARACIQGKVREFSAAQ